MADRYEIMEVNRDGSGYVVFFFEDGTESCGQHFHGAPVQDKAEFDEFMTNEVMPKSKLRHNNPGEPEVAAEIVAEASANKERAESTKEVGLPGIETR